MCVGAVPACEGALRSASAAAPPGSIDWARIYIDQVKMALLVIFDKKL